MIRSRCVQFEIAGHRVAALNGGAAFKFNESISLQVFCETQEEIDYFWDKLSEGVSELGCGWAKDQFGLFWRIAPTILSSLFFDTDPAKANRVMQATLKMKELDIANLKNA